MICTLIVCRLTKREGESTNSPSQLCSWIYFQLHRSSQRAILRYGLSRDFDLFATAIVVELNLSAALCIGIDLWVPILMLSPCCSSSLESRQYSPAIYCVFSCIVSTSFVKIGCCDYTMKEEMCPPWGGHIVYYQTVKYRCMSRFCEHKSISDNIAIA